MRLVGKQGDAVCEKAREISIAGKTPIRWGEEGWRGGAARGMHNDQNESGEENLSKLKEL